MPTAKSAPVKAGKAPDVEFTHDGLRAIETTTSADGATISVARDATFDEQIAVLAPQILEQAIGIVHHAAGGEVTVKGNVLTIKLEAI
jgi:hypothetical protein